MLRNTATSGNQKGALASSLSGSEVKLTVLTGRSI